MTKDDADNWRRVALQAMRNSKKPKTPTKPLGYTPPAGALCTVVDHIHAAEQWYAQQPRMELAVDVQPLVDIGQTLVDQSLVERMDISNDVETLSLRKEITLNLDGPKRKLKRKQPSATPNAVPKVVKGPKKPKPFIETPIKSGQPLEEARNIKAHKAPEVTFAKFLFEGPAALQCWSEVEEALESLPFMINATKRNEDPLDQSKWKREVPRASQTRSPNKWSRSFSEGLGPAIPRRPAKCMNLILPECSNNSPRLRNLALLQECPLSFRQYQLISQKDFWRLLLQARPPGLLSQCLSHQRIPMCWKNARTVLLYKKGDRLELSNWRPITLSNVIYKVFTSILAKRVTAFKTLISPEQKGFTDFDGCGDHTAVLSTMIERTVSTKNNIAVAWLDLKNAFGSVPHNVILETLAAMGFGAKFTNVVEDLYTNTTTSIVTAAGTTLPILIKSGVKQGDPISPILFNLCMEVLLRSLKWKDDVKLLAFADDLALAASTTDCLQSALDELVSNASRMGLTFNPTKCASLVVQKGKMCLDTAIKIGGSPVRLLDDEGVYTYLGINIGVHSRLSLEGPLKKGLDDTEKIVASNIAPWQKLDAIKTFILPRFSFFIRNGDPYLKDLDAFDKQMVRHERFAVTAQSEMSNQFLRNGRFVSFSAYRWIHRARLNLHLLNGTNKRAADQRCRICGQRETLPHVLNHCKRAMTLITRRHNAVQNRLVNAIPRRSEQMVYVNQRIPGICSARRPDIVVIKPDSKEAVIIDVTIPFENGARALVDAAQRKIEKYESEIGELQAIGYKVKAFAFVIGSLGTWCPLNTRLKELRVNRVYGRKMVTLMLAETVEFSKDIFWSHILADRYKIPKGRFFNTMPGVSKDLKSKSPTTAEPLSLQEEDADDTPSARSPRPAPRRKRPPAPTPMTLKLQRPAPKKKIAGTEEEDHKRDRIVKTPPPKRRRPTTQ
ncbi:hypothetical protein L596_025966 [Steinernema carpocapsae]|uniref:Reverse transcriptase domain-containing protein n=1 Tax=Steinernema carpocapsae TaxID=34508 RepID=A0A4U5M9A9_STECR|nr:hypothetical protein L596_025966 [Steinernema carpocapsae]